MGCGRGLEEKKGCCVLGSLCVLWYNSTAVVEGACVRDSRGLGVCVVSAVSRW
jgi:hypothetical protein